MWSAITAELAIAAVPVVPHVAPVPVPVPVPVPAVPTPIASIVGTTGKLVLVKALPWVAVSLSVAGVGGFVAGQKIASRRLAAQISQGTRSRSSHTPQMAPSQAPAIDATAPAPLPQLPQAVQPSGITGTAPTVAPAALATAPARRVVRHKPVTHQELAAGDDLAEEAQAVTRAESALRAGDWAGALAESDAYARRFPNGQLAEEAAYLGIRACKGSGDAAATQLRIEELRRRFPQSPLANPPAPSPARPGIR
jgi:hypothetical protein